MARAKVVLQTPGHIKKDDFVKIIAGKDRGKQGKVLRVFPQEGRLTVERVNISAIGSVIIRVLLHSGRPYLRRLPA